MPRRPVPATAAPPSWKRRIGAQPPQPCHPQAGATAGMIMRSLRLHEEARRIVRESFGRCPKQREACQLATSRQHTATPTRAEMSTVRTREPAPAPAPALCPPAPSVEPAARVRRRRRRCSALSLAAAADSAARPCRPCTSSPHCCPQGADKKEAIAALVKPRQELEELYALWSGDVVSSIIELIAEGLNERRGNNPHLRGPRATLHVPPCRSRKPIAAALSSTRPAHHPTLSRAGKASGVCSGHRGPWASKGRGWKSGRAVYRGCVGSTP